MVDAALAGNIPGLSWPNTNDLLKFLWEEYEAGKLRSDQIDPFFRAQTRTTYKVRSVVLVGQGVPYSMHVKRYLPKGWALKFQTQGEATHFLEPFPNKQTFSQVEMGTLKVSTKLTPGNQEIQIRYYTALYRAQNSGRQLVWDAWQKQSAKITVLDKPGEEFLKIVEAPELAAQIKSSLTVDGLEFDPAKEYYDLGIHAVDVPANLAFEVFARIDGLEYPFAEVIFRKGSKWAGFSTTGQLPEGVRPGKVDLILRSSEKVAGETLDLFEIWKGEIVLQDVLVKNPKQ